MKALNGSFYGWVSPDSSVHLFDGSSNAPTDEFIGNWKRVSIANKVIYAITLPNFQRFTATLDWDPLEKCPDGAVIFFKMDAAARATPRSMAGTGSQAA